MEITLTNKCLIDKYRAGISKVMPEFGIIRIEDIHECLLIYTDDIEIFEMTLPSLTYSMKQSYVSDIYRTGVMEVWKVTGTILHGFDIEGIEASSNLTTLIGEVAYESGNKVQSKSRLRNKQRDILRSYVAKCQ